MSSQRAPVLSPQELSAYDRMGKAAEQQSDIGGRMAGLAETTAQRGMGLLDETSPQVKAMQDFLRKLMQGETSFVDTGPAAQQFQRAKEGAAGAFGDVEKVLGERFARRGLSGGGQEMGGLAKYLAGTQAKTLAQQSTDIYSQVAAQKAAERAGAMDALLGSITGERGLGQSLTGMGGTQYGQAGGQFQGVSGALNSALGSLTGMPRQKSWFEQIYGPLMGGVSNVLGAYAGK